MALSCMWHWYTGRQDVIGDIVSHAYKLPESTFVKGDFQPGLDELDVLAKS